MDAGVYLVATPIGNRADASDRCREVLSRVDVIACEDTREMKKLLSILEIERHGRPLISLHAHNEDEASQKIIDLVHQGNSVAYASDAGMPAISDPGAGLVSACHHHDIPVTCIPGPSALTAAVALSGIHAEGFTFIGFFPRTHKEQSEIIEDMTTSPLMTVLYESPQRLVSTLTLLSENLGVKRQVCVCREITKKFEQIEVGTLAEVCELFSDDVKGECVIVVGPASEVAENWGEVEEVVHLLKDRGLSVKDVVDVVSRLSAAPKNLIKEIYLASSDQ